MHNVADMWCLSESGHVLGDACIATVRTEVETIDRVHAELRAKTAQIHPNQTNLTPMKPI